MLRYLALVWDHRDKDASMRAGLLNERLLNTAGQWTRGFWKPGLSLLFFRASFPCYSAHAVGELGIVLGVVFDRKTPYRSSAGSDKFFTENEAAAILESRGRSLIERYWGRYVAFLFEKEISEDETSIQRILRDPGGDIPCYQSKVGTLTVYFSRLDDFLQLDALRLTVNWDHLRLRVVTGNAWAEESALNEIECVHAGECVEHKNGRVTRAHYWHPFEVARRTPIEHLETAASELRSTVQLCTRAWASLHHSALHVLSGGLDSSIVLSCLANSARHVVCLNFRTLDPDSDERRYARLGSIHAGCELVEVERKSTVSLERIFECLPTVGPLHLVMRGLEVQPLITAVAQARGARAVFSGDGGDIVFFRGWPALGAIDYAYGRGLRRHLLKLTLDATEPAQLSVWQLLYQALQYGVLRRPWDFSGYMFDHTRLATDEVVASAREKIDFLNPWGVPVGDLPPGKRLHALGVSRPMLFRDPLPRAELDLINPLVSQPVVELCLRIPTYLHAAEGRDRAVARAAFAADLPKEIIARTWKGGVDRHLQYLLTSNLAKVRELLLDGRLVKAGILDRRRVAAALSDAPVRSTSHGTEIFGAFCTEVWLQRWAVA